MRNSRSDCRCFIFGALDVCGIKDRPADGDLVIAADKGYQIAISNGFTPHIVVGDFDSLGTIPDTENLIRLNVRKDDTDLEHAVRIALEKGYDDFVVYGAVGGKLDHTLGNIAVAEYIAQSGGKSIFFGDDSSFTVIRNSEIVLPARRGGRISVMSLSDISHGVSISGLSYEVDTIDMKRATTLGVSNAFIGKESRISVKGGTLLIVFDTNE